MIEVFVGFTQETPIDLLTQTLEAWDLPGFEPVALDIKGKKFELFRRVTAENISVGDYILSELGYGPVEENFAHECNKLITLQPQAGLFAIMPMERLSESHNGKVFLCRKGAAEKWPTPKTGDYIQEHAAAIIQNGFQAVLCEKLHYMPLTGSLPS